MSNSVKNYQLVEKPLSPKKNPFEAQNRQHAPP